MERFKGKIIPARMLYDRTVLKGQRVLVLGGGKTSCGPHSVPCLPAAARASLLACCSPRLTIGICTHCSGTYRTDECCS